MVEKLWECSFFSKDILPMKRSLAHPNIASDTPAFLVVTSRQR